MSGRHTDALLSQEEAAQLERLVALREQLRREQHEAVTPAVARYLQLADVYLFLGITHLGYTELLFPEET